MQKPFLALGTLFSVAAAAHAQQTNPYQQPLVQIIPAPNQPRMLFLKPTPDLPSISAAKGLAAVAGKTDVFTLAPGTYDSKELLELLASKAGGKATFVDGFATKTLDVSALLQGTAPELLAKMADYGVAAGKIGKDWVFVPVQAKATVRIPLYFRDLPDFKVLPRVKPFDFQFNKRPNPGKNLPPNAKPFDFNGDRLYFTPLGPKTR